MSPETVGIWNIFITISSIIILLDFGFSPSFTRNVSYVFSGVKILKTKGFATINKEDNNVDYGLLKGVIIAMRWFYLRISAVLFLMLMTLGTYYIHTILKTYNGNHLEVYISWFLLISINTYNLYTLYYDSLLQGKGLMKRSKQIIILGQAAYLIIATILILAGHNLIAIVSAQALSVIIVRFLSYHAFFTKEMRQAIHEAVPRTQNEILQAIYPNAIKVGLTSLGGFLIQKSAIIIGSLYLTLSEIASYGITMQLISVITALAGIYTATYQPKIAQLRVEQNMPAIKDIYLKGQFIIFSTYIIGGISLLILGGWALHLIGSQTQLMPFSILFVALLVSLIETNLSIAGSILMTKNEVPFFKASLISGASIVLGLLFSFHYTNLGWFCLVLVPLIVDLLYQAWKWPWEVKKELDIKIKDYKLAFFLITNYIKKIKVYG
jgi:O-antigen/teichoic acid export membrane protein